MANRRGETLELLHSAYDALVKAGEDSLKKAYLFGNVVHALHGIFTYRQLGDELGVTPTTVSKYDKLYRKFPTEKALLDRSRELGTHDVGLLASDIPAVHYAYAWHCTNCGSYAVVKERQEEGSGHSVAAQKAASAVPESAEVRAHAAGSR